MLGTVGGEPGAPGRLPMLGIVCGCEGAPGLPRLGTVTGGGGHTLEGEAACARRYDASVSPAKSMLTRRATLMPPAYSSRAGEGGCA